MCSFPRTSTISIFVTYIAGIVDNPTKSLFTYGPNGGWDTFYNPEYQPAFEVIFLDSDLQAQAQELCGDDSLCLFDIAATGDVGIGATTRESTELQETITELFKPSKQNCSCMLE